MADRRNSSLPPSLGPIGLSRVQAAEYIGVGPTTFDKLVADGLMPPGKRIYGRVVWDRFRLYEAFLALPDNGAGEAPNPWDAGMGVQNNEDQDAGRQRHH